MASSTISAFASARAERGIAIVALSASNIVTAIACIVAVSGWYVAYKAARNVRPQIIEVTQDAYARMLDFGDIKEPVMDNLVRNQLANFAHAYYSRKPDSVTSDLAHAWSMLNERQRAQRREEFTQATTQCASNPSRSIRVEVTSVTLEPGKIVADKPDGATIDFQKIYMSDGRELRRETWSVAVNFQLSGQPDAGSDLAKDNPLGISINELLSQQALAQESMQ